MNLKDAGNIAKDLMLEHGLLENGWSFQFDNARRRFGYCQSSTKTISMSKNITRLNDETKFTQTMLHEIAHALVGAGHGHDATWKRKAKEIGYKGGRLMQYNTPTKKYLAVCDECEYKFATHRRLKSACGKCCKKYNNNKFDARFMLRYELNEKNILVSWKFN